jgi:transcriptional regulator with GAF, ATPase, and Fis domain
VEAVAHTSQIVLITGETGVGKEMIPGIIHLLSGLTGPMLTVNVAGLDDTLFSDTLFGHVKGAFTGAQGERRGLVEEAAGGTLFLDEIGNLSPSSQLKLLRLLQEGEYHPLGQDRVKHADVRIIAATNEDLWQLENRAKFRRDLIYRLRTHHLHLPPLRERREDIPLLVDFFLAEAARDLDKPKPTPPKELNDLLGTYPFPGNIRELKALVFDAVSRHTSRVLSLDVFREYITSGGNEHRQRARAGDIEEDGIRFPASLPTIEKTTRLLIAEAMQRANNNQRIASNLLGISQPALSKRLKKYKEGE